MRWGRSGRPRLPKRASRVPSVRPRMPSEPAAGAGERTHGMWTRGGTCREREGRRDLGGGCRPWMGSQYVYVSVRPFWLSACAPGSWSCSRSGPSARAAVVRGAHSAAVAVAMGGPFLSLVI